MFKFCSLEFSGFLFPNSSDLQFGEPTDEESMDMESQWSLLPGIVVRWKESDRAWHVICCQHYHCVHRVLYCLASETFHFVNMTSNFLPCVRPLAFFAVMTTCASLLDFKLPLLHLQNATWHHPSSPADSFWFKVEIWSPYSPLILQIYKLLVDYKRINEYTLHTLT